MPGCVPEKHQEMPMGHMTHTRPTKQIGSVTPELIGSQLVFAHARAMEALQRQHKEWLDQVLSTFDSEACPVMKPFDGDPSKVQDGSSSSMTAWKVAKIGSVDSTDGCSTLPDRRVSGTRGILGVNFRHRLSTMKRLKSKAYPNGSSVSASATDYMCIGRAKAFIFSPLFDKLRAGLLIANSIFIGFQVEYMFAETTPTSINIIDFIFCVAFVLELVSRMLAFGCQYWCHAEDMAWNWFDFVVVSFSTLDTVLTLSADGGSTALGNISVLRIIRIVRITRVLRIIRVLKFFKDLRILIAAIGSTLKTATFALILLLLIMYIFGIGVSQLVAEYVTMCRLELKPVNDDLLLFFGGVPRSIFSLFMTISGGIDWYTAATPLEEVGSLCTTFYVTFVALMVLCVMNVLNGIFVQCAIETAQKDRDNVIQNHMAEKHRYIATLKELFRLWDKDGSGRCTREQFEERLHDEQMQALLRSLEMEVHDALSLFQMLDVSEDGYVDLDEFVNGCITLRGSASAVNMEKLWKSLHIKMDSIEKLLLDGMDPSGKHAAPQKRSSVRPPPRLVCLPPAEAYLHAPLDVGEYS